MSKKQQKVLTDQSREDMVNFVIVETLKDVLQERVIKRYLENIYIICDSTDNLIYKSYADGMADRFGISFSNGLSLAVETWDHSEGSLIKQIYNSGQDINSDSGYYARKITEDLIKGAKEIKCADKLNVHGSSGHVKVEYDDQEKIDELKSLCKSTITQVEEEMHFAQGKCESKIEENVFYGSILTLLKDLEGYVVKYLESDSELKELLDKVTSATSSASKKVQSSVEVVNTPKIKIRLKNPGDK